jgi:hypothetical protein
MGSQLHAVHDVLAGGREGDGEREDIVTRYMEMVRSANRCDQMMSETDRGSCKNWLFLNECRIPYLASPAMPGSIPLAEVPAIFTC